MMFAGAIGDFRNGLSRWRVWVALASEDISDQHKRTTLGPLWLLLNYLAFAGIFILIFRRGEGITNYASYVAVGLFVWSYISETITQSVTLFSREENFIKGTTLPLSVYILRQSMQSMIRAAYTLGGCLAIVLSTDGFIIAGWPWAMLGAAIILVSTPAVVTIFSISGVLVPDLQFVMSNIMRLGLFLTPIFWTVGNEEGIRHILSLWNPFSYYLSLLRDPILDGKLNLNSILFCTLIFFIIWFFALFLLDKYRNKIVFAL